MALPNYAKVGQKYYQMAPGGYYKEYVPEGSSPYIAFGQQGQAGTPIYKRTMGGMEWVSDPSQVDWGQVQYGATLPQGATETGSLYDLYRGQAQSELEPLYSATEQQTKSKYDLMKQEMEEALKSEYAKRGILRSGLYGEALGKGETSLATEKGAALESLNRQKLQDILNRASSYQQMQMSGEQNELAKAQAQAEAQAAEQERQWKERMAQLQYATAVAGSKSGGSGSATQWQSKQSAIASLSDDIAQGIQAIATQGFQPWATESLIAQLQAAYPELTPSEIATRVYDYRRPLENKYKF